MDTRDVVVIGGGVAGAAAALAASGAGASVLLIRRGPGATALANGGWSTAPPAPLRAAISRAGLEIIDCNGALPHPDGRLIECEAAAASHARAGVEAGSRTVVCGIEGLPSFHARALAALWQDAAGRASDETDAAVVLLDETPSAGWSPVSLAALLEREPDRLGRELARIARETSAARLIVPAVLGLDEHVRTIEAVADAAGVMVAEALGVAPSVPGWRLDRAVLRALDAAGVRVIHGNVRAPAGAVAARDGVIEHITLANDGGAQVIAASAFVLATGKYLGGGITADDEFAEPALGCDVAIERFALTIDDPAAALVLTDPVRTGPQPVLSIGVRADAIPRNVFPAGSVRAGIETATLGLGAAAHDGWTAGEHAAAYALRGARP